MLSNILTDYLYSHHKSRRDSCWKEKKITRYLKFPSTSTRQLPLDMAHRFFYLALRFILGSFACTDISISPRTRVSIFRAMKRRTFARGSTSRHAARVRAWNAAPGSGFCNIETGVLDVASRRSNLSRVYTYTGCLVTSTREAIIAGTAFNLTHLFITISNTRFSR